MKTSQHLKDIRTIISALETRDRNAGLSPSQRDELTDWKRAEKDEMENEQLRRQSIIADFQAGNENA